MTRKGEGNTKQINENEKENKNFRIDEILQKI